jgi:Domain of unknown function (DUF5655)
MAARARTVPRRTFFSGRALAARLFASVERAVRALGPVTVRVTRSQIAFSTKRAFAWAWCPDRWLTGDLAPLVLSVDLPRRDGSPRWKEVVEVRPGRFLHHLELRRASDIDGEVKAWLRDAFAATAKARRKTKA